MKELTLFPANKHQAKQIHQLIKRVLDVYGLHHLRPAGVDEDIDDLENNYTQNNGSFWVLVNGEGYIVGSCGLFKLNDSTCELRKMYLDKLYQGKGYGKEMLANVVETARKKGYANITLKTNSNLKAAIALYEKNGFKIYTPPEEEKKEDCDVAMILEFENDTQKVL